jgi:hypothetical protein
LPMPWLSVTRGGWDALPLAPRVVTGVLPEGVGDREGRRALDRKEPPRGL